MSYDNPRITSFEMRLLDMVVAMSEGNPGATTVLMELFSTENTIDPDSAWKGYGPLFGLDSLDCYGSRIWMFYKDVCGQDIEKAHALLRGVQLGFVSEGGLPLGN